MQHCKRGNTNDKCVCRASSIHHCKRDNNNTFEGGDHKTTWEPNSMLECHCLLFEPTMPKILPYIVHFSFLMDQPIITPVQTLAPKDDNLGDNFRVSSAVTALTRSRLSDIPRLYSEPGLTMLSEGMTPSSGTATHEHLKYRFKD